MLVHSRAQDAKAANVRLALSRSAYSVDIWGRRHDLPRRDGKVRLPVQTVPILIAGSQADALALRASVRFMPEVLQSSYQNHSAQVTFANPYGQAVSGKVRITPPAGWTVRPVVRRFSLAPGRTWTGQITVAFPYRATAGLKKMDVAIEVEAKEGRRIEAPAFFYLTLKDITFDFIPVLTPNGDLEVTQTIINRGDKPVSYTCFAQIPQQPRQSSVLQDLAPGARAEKVFRFRHGVQLRGKTLRTGLRELQGPAILNRTAVIR